MCRIRKPAPGAGVMAQRFRTLVVLAEVPGSIPRKKPSGTWPWGTPGARLPAPHMIVAGKTGGKKPLLSVWDKNYLEAKPNNRLWIGCIVGVLTVSFPFPSHSLVHVKSSKRGDRQGSQAFLP